MTPLFVTRQQYFDVFAVTATLDQQFELLILLYYDTTAVNRKPFHKFTSKSEGATKQRVILFCIVPAGGLKAEGKWQQKEQNARPVYSTNIRSMPLYHYTLKTKETITIHTPPKAAAALSAALMRCCSHAVLLSCDNAGRCRAVKTPKLIHFEYIYHTYETLFELCFQATMSTSICFLKSCGVAADGAPDERAI